MILILIALIAMTTLGVWGCGRGSDICTVFTALGLLGLAGYIPAVAEYYASGYKAEVINREYHRSFTRDEVFYARGTINTALDNNRREVCP